MKTVALALSAVALLSTAAFAGDMTAAQQKAVVYSDLNLGTQEGVTALRQRIVAAAEEVCTDRVKNKQDNSCKVSAEQRAYNMVGEQISFRLASAQ